MFNTLSFEGRHLAFWGYYVAQAESEMFFVSRPCVGRICTLHRPQLSSRWRFLCHYEQLCGNMRQFLRLL